MNLMRFFVKYFPIIHTFVSDQNLGCNNGIWGFHENIVTLQHTMLPDF